MTRTAHPSSFGAQAELVGSVTRLLEKLGVTPTAWQYVKDHTDARKELAEFWTGLVPSKLVELLPLNISRKALIEFLEVLFSPGHATVQHYVDLGPEVVEALLVGNLTPEELEVLILRYGLNGKEPLSSYDIGLRLNKDVVTVNRRRVAALDKIRQLGRPISPN